MKKPYALITYFDQLINDTKPSKRLKENGEKIKPSSIDNYRYVLNNLIQFSTNAKFDLRICDVANSGESDHPIPVKEINSSCSSDHVILV